MIKATDLRIGNWVYVRDKVAKKVTSISSQPRSPVICTILDNCVWAESHFSELAVEGIKLTREILIGAVFLEISNSNTFVFQNYIKLVLEDNDWNDVSFDVYVNENYITCLSFLHELQNLIYSLTKKESEIEL